MEMVELENLTNSREMVLSPKTENKMNKIFDSLVQIDEKDVIVRGNCKLCNHSLRFESEKKWEELEFNFTKTTDWINDQFSTLEGDEKNMTFSTLNVKSHMKNHYQEQERQIRLRDYSEKIEELVKNKKSKARLLEYSLAVCEENLARVASSETYGDVKSEKERSDSINKVVSTMLSVIELQAKIEGELTTADAIQEKFTSLWVKIINKEDSPVKREILYGMLEDFASNYRTDA